MHKNVLQLAVDVVVEMIVVVIGVVAIAPIVVVADLGLCWFLRVL